MRRVCLLVSLVLVLPGNAALGQSLGDVARQTREKEKSKSSASKKVITNEDIPESPEANEPPPEMVEPHSKSRSPSGEQTARQWKNAILAQKTRVASLQAQIDKLNGSIHYVDASVYINGVRYNQQQAKKQQQVEVMQTQLGEQKQKLSDMQSAARNAGMGSAVYDP